VRWQEAISALADGEDAGVDARLLESHLAHCPACRRYRDDVTRFPGPIVEPVAAIGTQPWHVARAVAAADRSSSSPVVRVLLLVVALEIVVLSLPELLAGSSSEEVHDARHLGAFTLAYGVGLLVVVVRPARARTMLPVAGVLAVALVITAVVDLATGSVPLLGEALHLPETLSVLFVWLLASPTRSGSPGGRAVDPPSLTVVPDDPRTPRTPGA
jgi:predicted anti-sigma-YlaC factor YlaD